MQEWEKLLYSLLSVAGYIVLCVCCYRHYLRHHPKTTFGQAELVDNGVIVAYASQSGNALRLAEAACGGLDSNASLLPLNRVNNKTLSGASRALFVVSTYGDGEAPDNGVRFEKQLLKQIKPTDLAHLEYAVLALGDSHYPDFCAFGRRLDSGLKKLGARSLFERLELDSSQDPDFKAAQMWLQQATGNNADRFEVSQALTEKFQPWTLLERQTLNPKSASEALIRLRFSALNPEQLNWQAGDIAELVPRNSVDICRAFLATINTVDGKPLSDPELVALLQDRKLLDAGGELFSTSLQLRQWIQTLPLHNKREYSIASIPTDGVLELLMRQRCDEAGKLGLASAWLSQGLGIGQQQWLRLRPNPLFNSPPNTKPLILIGSGSGLAGLWGHLQARRQHGITRNWLIFGERSPVTDRIYQQQIAELQRDGFLPRLDLVFSRGSERPSYVQHRLLESAAVLQEWLADGATVMVCGSRLGMGEGVDDALRQVMGEDAVDRLADQGRYLRDVY
ncbi:sulfite reductase, alpha subunit (flavoprotein) [Spongiibacter sp. IMCC21906]|uniref:flavodoxin domain-containing protein n=1 Tax=Spongiibacter sp. IMCC21906 TaxID=1620392 RepID=UPI00062DD952|nr:sulfite reductase flavoprotein subunit alpha [Spongiibacter sp. IMCC21906]AKH70144.1 sulfite reductase, alpha subunit (flavoprotein) [Spongiibacter sp. IMCC21906]